MDEFGTFFQPLMYPENAHYAQKVNFYKNAPKKLKFIFGQNMDFCHSVKVQWMANEIFLAK